MNYISLYRCFKIVVFSFLFVTIGISFNSCSTKKAGFFNVKYHNTTTHYNVWWNGNQSLIEGEKLLKQKNKDDYTNILRVFQLGSKDEAISFNPQWDRALEKGTKGIKKHSILIKGKEYVNWVRNCYLLIGKAQYYKQDYTPAISTFRFIMSQYKETPEAYEAVTWYARCLIQDKDYSLAETALNQLRDAIKSGKAPKKLAKKMYPVYADCAIAEKKYQKAIQYLNLSIEENTNRKLNTRQYFILGQIFQLQKKRTTAAQYYKKVIKRGAPYEMEFNAKINLAACYDIKSGDEKAVLKLLTKMLKDKKNEEFRDQIYYALGEVAMASKDATKACNYWKQSVEVSVSNKAQKIKSALTLADTYYDVFEDYESAQQYYAIALEIMDADYPNYQKIRDKQMILNPLVENLKIIKSTDSLLRVSNMQPKERDKFIEKLIQNLKQQEQERLEKELIAANDQTVKESSNTLKGSWYFYNASTVQKGKESFARTWGKRTLGDNWRISNKEASFDFNEDIAENEESETPSLPDDKKAPKENLSKANESDPYKKEFYLKNILTTKEQKDSADIEIAKAMLSAGFIYNDGLKNEDKALAVLLELCERYPSSSYVLPAYYQLFRILDKKGDTPKANYYKNLILMGFPDSDYANLIRDENYYQEMLKRENVVQKEYEAIYLEFQASKYQSVATKARSAIDAYRNPLLTPKFLYLEALSLGKMQGKNILISKLEFIEKNYPTHEITPLVRRQLELLKSNKVEFATEAKDQETIAENNTSKTDNSNKTTTDNTEESKDKTQTTPPAATTQTSDELPPESQVYRQRDHIQHYFIVIVDDKNINATDLRVEFSTFNEKFFSTLELKSSNVMFTTSPAQQMITIQRFPTAEKAMEYYNFVAKSDLFKTLDAKQYKLFVISIQNYPTFYNEKNIEAYDKFFKKYYVK